MQCLLGHGFFGEYYSRHVPSESAECPCGDDFQSREHILAFCPLYASKRHLLRQASRRIDMPIILGTLKGRQALLMFIAQTSAFSKAARTQPPDDSTPNSRSSSQGPVDVNDQFLSGLFPGLRPGSV
jgi:hypothetical protein